MKKIMCSGLFVFFFTLTMAPAFAKLVVKPSVSIREEYNDNVFLDDTDEEDDFITTVSPRLLLEYMPNKAVDLSLDYGLYFRFYSDNSDLNDTSIRETQNVEFRAHLRPRNRIYIDISDTYKRVPIDVRRKFAPDNKFENMTDSNTFSISPSVDIPLTSTVSSLVGYRYTNRWYKVDEGNNSDSHAAYVSLTKRFPFGLDISIHYDYVAYRPDLSDDADIHEVSAGASYQLRPNVKVWGEVGKTYVDFSNRSNEDENIWNVGSEYIFGVITLSATYSEYFSEYEAIDSDRTDTLAVSDLSTYLFETKDSVTTGVTKIKRFDLFLSTRKYFDMTVNPYYSEQEELETDRDDKRIGVAASIQKPLSTKMTVSFNGYLEEQKFSPQDEEVNQFSLGPSFDYILSRRITTSIGYRYNKRDSDIENNDYDNNIVWLEASLSL